MALLNENPTRGNIRTHLRRAPSRNVRVLLPTTTRTPGETRALALALQDKPIPLLSKKNIEHRWKVGPDTVRKILKFHGVDPGPAKGLQVPLNDLLTCEGIDDAFLRLALARPEGRIIFEADLLTLEEWQQTDPRRKMLTADSHYRHLKENQSISIRIGKLHRFRPDLRQARRWHELRSSEKSDKALRPETPL